MLLRGIFHVVSHMTAFWLISPVIVGVNTWTIVNQIQLDTIM